MRVLGKTAGNSLLTTIIITVALCRAAAGAAPVLDGRLDPAYFSGQVAPIFVNGDTNIPATVFVLDDPSVDPQHIWVCMVQEPVYNDLSYGTYQHFSWNQAGKAHTLKDLTHSDKQEFSILNACGEQVLDIVCDVCDTQNASMYPPWGWGVSFTSGEGMINAMNGGIDTSKIAYMTSLPANLNEYPTNNVNATETTLQSSPPFADATNYIPVAAFSQWEYKLVYEIRIDRSVFTTAQCPDGRIGPVADSVLPGAVHASPNKSYYGAIPPRDAAIGDYVWLDMNGDGIQDPSEPGIADIPVTLYNGGGSVVSNTTTDLGGKYLFDKLAPGYYSVGFTLPTGAVFTFPDAGGDDAKDSDADQQTGRTAVTLLSSGETDLTWDAGAVGGCTLLASLGDFVWHDTNDNGVQDPGEAGVPNVEVTLYDWQSNVVSTTTTDANGRYLFSYLPMGVYSVGFTLPSGYVFSAQDQGGNDARDSDADVSTGRTTTTSLEPGENDLTWDAGIIESSRRAFKLVKYTDTKHAAPYQPVKYHYELSNTGGASLTVTSFVDDNGTPNYGGDDFTPTFTGGDDGNGLLDDGETWTYEATVIPPVKLWQEVDGTNTYAGELLLAMTSGSGDVTATFITSMGVNDNAYGTSAPSTGWTRDHKFNDLVGSDKAQLVFRNGNGDVVFDAKIDYISAVGGGKSKKSTVTTNFPSGYGTLGVTGGDGGINVGNASDVLAVHTSLSDILNTPAYQSGYTVNSPVYPDPNWEFRMIYSIKLKGSTFGASGFGGVAVASVHNSPNKSFNPEYPDPCDQCVTNLATATAVVDGQTVKAWDTEKVCISTNTIPPPPTLGAAIGDRVWMDENRNGIQDPNEPGRAGVEVTLYDAGGNAIATTNTCARGIYLFDNLVPGTYSVGFTLPDGLVFSPRDQGGDDAADSDADTTTGKTIQTTLAADERDLTWDAGLYRPGQTDIILYKIPDNPLAKPFERVTFTYMLKNTGNQSATVQSLWDDNATPDYPSDDFQPAYTGGDVNGNSQLDPGETWTYTAQIYTPLCMQQPDHNNDYAGTLVVTQDPVTGNITGTYITSMGVNDNAYGTSAPSTGWTRDHKFRDLVGSDKAQLVFRNGAGDVVFDAKIDYISSSSAFPSGYGTLGVTGGDGGINVGNAADVVAVHTSLSDILNTPAYQTGYTVNSPVYPDPNWEFRMIYSITLKGSVFGSSGFGKVDVASVHNSPSKSFNPVYPEPCEKCVYNTAVGLLETYSGVIAVTNDASVCVVTNALAEIGDTVWYDQNNNGIQDAGEPPAPGVTVTLYTAGGSPLGSKATDAQGKYLFGGLPPGTYSVGFTAPAGYEFTLQDQGGDDAVDSDADPLTGRCANTDLASGESDLTWDAGLVLGDELSASLGDYVWIDANGNGIQDGGEPGKGDVKVWLFDGANNVVGSALTDSEGYYLFSHLTPGTYHVRFELPDGFVFTGRDQGANDATDSDADTATGVTIPTTLVAGEQDLTWDAGLLCWCPFKAAIGDYVWVDTNEDGIQNDGPTGVPGVLVTLYDATHTAVATTNTDANGYYLFDQLVPGVYSVGFTLPQGFVFTTQDQGANDALDSDADTTTGLAIQTTLGPGEIDRTWDAGLVRGLAALGDYVWEDVNYDGIQNDGPTGVSGVTVELYSVNSTTQLVGSVQTDANGYYLFDNLVPGDYFVKFYPPRGYFVTTLQDQGLDDAVDSDANPVTGETVVTTLTSGETDLTWDCGINGLAGVGDFVWLDINHDGVQDPGETGEDNTKVTLYDVNSNVVSSAVTDTNGFYQFLGLVPGTYFLHFEADTTTVFQISPKDQGGNDAKDSDADPVTGFTDPFTLVGGQYDPTRDCGLWELPTYAAVSDLTALTEGGRVYVQWRTTAELGVAGFEVWRRGKGDRYERVGGGVVPVLPGVPQGGAYKVADKTAAPGKTYTYKLAELESTGGIVWHGPYTVKAPEASGKEAMTGRRGRGAVAAATSADGTIRDPSGGYEITPNPVNAVEAPAGRSRVFATSALGKEAGVTSDRLKIIVTKSTIQYVSAAEIATLMGKTTTEVQSMIQNGQLQLTTRGVDIPYLAASGFTGIYFYGEHYEDVYTDKNVYWLQPGPGVGMAFVGQFGTVPNPGGTYASSSHAETNRYAQTAVHTDPEDDYWLWDYLIAGNASLDTKTLPITAPGAVGPAGAVLKVGLQGTTPTHHHVDVYLNGALQGATEWDGTGDHIVSFPVVAGTTLVAGSNDVTFHAVLNPSVPYSTVYINKMDLDYERMYEAEDGKLRFSGEGRPTVTVGGFSDPNIIVLNVTDPKQPVLVVGPTLDYTGSDWRMSFAPDTPTSQYFVFGVNDVTSPYSVEAIPPNTLATDHTGADYVIIAASSLVASAQELANYRQSQGLTVKVINVEDIYNAFADGFYTPEAIRTFFANAEANWTIKPSYALLAGQGTYDYKDFLGFHDNLLPVILMPTPFGLFASDNHLADLDGDSIPEVAIGRLTVVAPAQLTAMIGKIKAYEAAAGAWRQKVVMVADGTDAGGFFGVNSNQVADHVPVPPYNVQRIYIDTLGDAQTRTDLLAALQDGALVINYMGHSGLFQWAANPTMLTSLDVQSLTNAPRLPVLYGLTCVVGRHSIPGITTIAEDFVNNPNGGAIAAFVPSGLSLNGLARRLGECLFESTFEVPQPRLGDTLLRGMDCYELEHKPMFMIDIFNLMGDPALKIMP